MTSFKEYLTEKVVLIDRRDIDFLYEPFKPLIKEISNAFAIKDFDEMQIALKRIGYDFDKFKFTKKLHSNQLKSEAAKAAHIINPVDIELSHRVGSNHYLPSEKIVLGFPKSAVYGLESIETVPHNLMKSLKAEFTEIKLKTSIRHELTHWIDDSLNNLHMTNIFKQGDRKKFFEFLSAGTTDPYLGHIEIEAAVAVIDEIRIQIGNTKYFSLTWDELLDYSPNLKLLNDRLGKPWRRKILSRMARENLLSQSLRP